LTPQQVSDILWLWMILYLIPPVLIINLHDRSW
jgi:hypothetical protein